MNAPRFGAAPERTMATAPMLAMAPGPEQASGSVPARAMESGWARLARTGAGPLGIDVERPQRLTLADGRCVRVRPVHPSDAAGEQAFVTTLSPQSRRRRFHGALRQLPSSVLQAMTSIDRRRSMALVAEAGCADGAARLVADARYVIEDVIEDVIEERSRERRSAEFAIAVADDWQGVGLGRALMRQLAGLALASGLRELQGMVLADNVPMLALMQQLGARLRGDLHDAGIVRVSFAL